jgi:hypothetical protein
VARLLKQGLIEIDDAPNSDTALSGCCRANASCAALLGQIPAPAAEEIDRHARPAVTR